MEIVDRLVPDELWQLFEHVVPSAPERPQGGGRRRYGDREVLAAIIFVVTSGCAWRQLPPVFGPSGPTVHRRFAEWHDAGVWTTLHRLAQHSGKRAEQDWTHRAIESVHIRAKRIGAVSTIKAHAV